MSSVPSSPSVAGSPGSMTSDILTPTRKVQALLAQFDDSDSEPEAPARPQNSRQDAALSFEPPAEAAKVEGPVDNSEDDDVLVPRRLLPAAKHTIADEPDLSPHVLRGAGSLLDSEIERDKEDRQLEDSEEDDIFAARRAPITNGSTRSPSRSPSPLFFPSPEDRKSKFLTLVEKHRKQRLEKEAEEAAKLAARVESHKPQKSGRRPRGSSPADDIEEDSDLSDGAGGKKLSTQARPTRKASKKALEEMHRETQRLSRNMQLAHQARTKKKISKDSLLARFGFPVASPTIDKDNGLSASSSSRAASDNESNRIHDTPPTSPVSDGADHHKATAAPTVDKSKGRALSAEPAEKASHAQSVALPAPDVIVEQPLKPTIKSSSAPARAKRSLLAMTMLGSDDSDSDLEVVTSRGDRRKFAAFERLPAKKAKETASHIALRSLANLIGEDRKRSVNAAEVEVSLRRAARMQARQERQLRIDELKSKGVVIQTAEEREREAQEVEDLLERARQEAVEIQKREKALAKKEGNYTKDGLDDDDDDDSDDGDFAEGEDGDNEASEEEDESDLERADDEGAEDVEKERDLLDNEAGDGDSTESGEGEAAEDDGNSDDTAAEEGLPAVPIPRKSRTQRIVSDDEDEEITEGSLRSPQLPRPAKTPQTLSRSPRKQIPGLQMSDDLPIGLTQAFAATMAETQSQDNPKTQEQDSLTMTADLPSPNIAMVPKLYRLESIDMITDSQPASQTQPLNINLSFSQSQKVPQSPAIQSSVTGVDVTPSQPQFELTQDTGYVLSPFIGNRFTTETPQQPAPNSTVDTVIVPRDVQESPLLERRNRLRRGRINTDDSDHESTDAKEPSAFDVMQTAATRKSREAYDKAKSRALAAFDEAAEESEDEYAGLGGASDDDGNDEENEDDRRMIDEDTQVGAGDGAKLAKLFADRERQQDEAAVSKLMKDITTGALRRKRGNDDLDISDEEDVVVRRREAKRREFAKMRRELLKDEAVGKIAEDKKKEAFLRSIEDRAESDDDENFDLPETQVEDESQAKDIQPEEPGDAQESTTQDEEDNRSRALTTTGASKLNQSRQTNRPSGVPLNRRPGTLAEIRESVSFLIEEPDSQAGTIDLGLSDSEDEPEAYVDFDRHLQEAEADENAEDADDLGDFIVDDDGLAKEEEIFKKPVLPESRAPFSERRTKERANVINRLSMIRQASSSGSSSSTKMAFYSATSSASGSFNKVPTLLRRATTNSSLGSMAGRDESVSATGVTSRTERGKASEEKEFVRKGTGSRRNAVNYRPTVREEKMSQRAGIAKKSAAKGKKSGFLGGLFNGGSWA